MLKLFNSLTRKKEILVPLNGKKVTMYVCGITPYDTTHLGHAFVYIWFDVLVRYLTFKGYKVTYTQNVTDINDRDKDILQRAKEQNISWKKLADFWTKRFLDDMHALGWIMPTNYLYASQNLNSMIRLIQKLLVNGFAYERNGSVYLDISQKKDFGKLSRLTNKQMLKIAKDVDEDIENPDKKHPLDITLWRATEKNQPPHIPSFVSPFGEGRPGWHIECSAMSTSTLGEQIDIHGGGIDLIYPHHEAEIAQSEGATGKIPFAKYWMHTGLISYQGEKMSKSLGNLVMVSKLLKKYSASEIRWLLLSHHYRQPWEFFETDLKDIRNSVSLIKKALDVKTNNLKDKDNIYFEKFEKIMDNDLDTPLVLAFCKTLAEKILQGKDKNISSLQNSLSQILKTLGFVF